MLAEIEEVLWKMLNKICKEGTNLGEWNSGLISSIFTKGKKDNDRHYRGVTIDI